ncbi:CCC motif membrane protein [Joostella sp. CR20]|uniref:CCC motif membrane protein n=1 Tax=Joostella sp. CR20 TaxID=2804312 RepID=UPI00313EBCE4
MEQEKLPNATLIIVLGILSFLCCCFYGSGIITSGVALFLANNSQKKYAENPELYSNYSTIKTGKVIAIIGLVLNILAIIFFVWMINALGWDVITSNDQELIQEKVNELFGQ